jgi:hypothetical protein
MSKYLVIFNRLVDADGYNDGEEIQHVLKYDAEDIKDVIAIITDINFKYMYDNPFTVIDVTGRDPLTINLEEERERQTYERLKLKFEKGEKKC